MDPNRYRHFAVLLSASASFALAACADTRGGSIPYNVALGAPDRPKIAALESDYRISPADKLSIKVDIWTVADGDTRCKRKVRAEANVKIFGVGGAIEKRLLSDLERSYQKSADFTNRFVAEKGL